MSYKIYSHNIPGPIELVKVLLTAAGQKYENIVVPLGQSHPDLAGASCLPVVITPEGVKMHEPQAVGRYVARKYHFYGTNDLEFYKVERACCRAGKIFKDLKKMMHLPCDKKLEAKKHYAHGKGKAVFDILNKCLEEEGRGYFAGNQASAADFMVAVLYEKMEHIMPELIHQYPKLRDHHKRIMDTHPAVATYVKQRAAEMFKNMQNAPAFCGMAK